MATFGLLHGAWHGAWCWEGLIAELQSRGHRAIAMDLPCDRREATFDDYAQAAAAALPPDPEVVVVGHSMAGMVIPLLALRRPVGQIVFLCGLVPDRQGDPPEEGPATHPAGSFDALTHGPDGSHWWPNADAATRILYHDCPPDVAAAAFARLRRQQTALWEGLLPMAGWPAAPVAAIHCADDRAINPDWSRWVALRRLGVDSLELPGGHSPMLSRPAQLAETLAAIATGG